MAATLHTGFLFLLRISAFAVFLLCSNISYAEAPYDVLPSDVAHVRKSLYFMEHNKVDDALYQAKQSRNPLIIKIVTWLAYRQGWEEMDFDHITRFIKENPDWPDQRILRQRAEESISLTTPANDVINWFKENPPVTARGKWALVNAYLQKQGSNSPDIPSEKEIHERLREIWAETNFTAQEEKTFLAEHGERLTTSDHNARIDRLIWDERITQARKMLFRADSEHQKLFDARMKVLNDAPGMDEALKSIPASLQNDPGLLYARIKWRKLKGKDDDAMELLPKIPATLPRPGLWWDLMEDYARTLVRKKHYKEAYQLVKKHSQEDKANFASAEWLAGWIALRFLHQPDTAFKHFELLYNNVEYPISLARGAYWLGRASEEGGKHDQAKRWYKAASTYPTTFYGQLGAAKLSSTASLVLPSPPAATEADMKRFRNNELLRAAYVFVTLDEPGWAKIFLKAAATNAKTVAEAALISHFGIAVKKPELAIAAASTAAQKGMILPESHYPVMGGLPVPDNNPAFYYSIIRQESHFNKNAESSAGALGLMQLMPATAKFLAEKMSVRYSKDKLTDDPDYNVKLGCFYLNRLLNQFDGSYILAVAAYNGGSGNVRKWINTYGNPKDLKSLEKTLDWIEMIPFYETRNYVHRILESMQVYRLRLAPRGQANIPASTLVKDILQ